jgi:hypothetical protein
VRFATWVKKHMAIKPELNHIRKLRAEQRPWQGKQVERMF